MGVLRCDHPDIEEFIRAKDTGGLSNFNISIGVTDAFMQAVQSDGEIELIHRAEPGVAQKEAGAYAARFDGSAYKPHHVEGGLLVAPDRESWEMLRREVFVD